jgi:hypothetical protein
VFLHGSANTGYLLTGGQILRRVANGSMTLSHDGDFKLNEGIELIAGQRFSSFNEFLARVF